MRFEYPRQTGKGLNQGVQQIQEQMKRVIILLIYTCVAISIHAQRITREYNNVSLSDALRQLNDESKDYEINFLYNELEDFRITTSVHRKTVPDVIRQMIGFYPIHMAVDGTEITVECIQKTDTRYKGTVIDEQGNPMAYANIALLSTRDSGCNRKPTPSTAWW